MVELLSPYSPNYWSPLQHEKKIREIQLHEIFLGTLILLNNIFLNTVGPAMNMNGRLYDDDYVTHVWCFLF